MNRHFSGAIKEVRSVLHAISCLMIALAVLAVFAVEAGAMTAYAEDLSVGSYVTFGTYPQTAEGNDETPIEWLVLDCTGDKALLLSRYALDEQPYHTENTDITWEQCTLRAWLNDDFFSRAFTSEEQAAILLTDVDNSRSQSYGSEMIKANDGSNTQDKVFLLSYAESNRYLGVTRLETSVEVQAAPTAYAIALGAWASEIYQTVDGEAAGLWWLRSSSGRQYYASYVGGEESLYFDYVNQKNVCVRPALWVDLGAGIF